MNKNKLFNEETGEVYPVVPATPYELSSTTVFERTDFKNGFNAHLFPDLGEINSGEVVTVPDQTMPIIDILRRFSNGLEIGEDSGGYYEEEGEELFPAGWEKWDLSEKYDYVRGSLEKAKKHREDLEVLNNQLENEKLEQEIIARHQARMEQAKKDEPPKGDS